jgi:hypothetical protein
MNQFRHPSVYPSGKESVMTLTATTIYRIFRLRGLSAADAAAWTLWVLRAPEEALS